MLFPGFLGWVHDPVPLKDRFSILSPRKLFNPQVCYRVTWSPEPIHKHEDSLDVLAPYNSTKRGRHHEDLAHWTFYEGAEEGLDRYLFWLLKSHLKNEYGTPPQLFVCKQKTADLQNEMTPVYGKKGIIFVGPGQSEHFSLLFHENKEKLSLF